VRSDLARGGIPTGFQPFLSCSIAGMREFFIADQQIDAAIGDLSISTLSPSRTHADWHRQRRLRREHDRDGQPEVLRRRSDHRSGSAHSFPSPLGFKVAGWGRGNFLQFAGATLGAFVANR